MDQIKQAFQRIKQDILLIQNQILGLKQQIEDLKYQKPAENQQSLANLSPTIPTDTPTQTPIPTDTPTHIPTHQQSVQPLKPLNLRVSTGNGGVPTDKQTNRQTNQQTDNWTKNTQNLQKTDDFEKITEILDSLDSMKKEIRLKFKRLTPQEMIVFTALYTLEEQNIDEITYKLIANRLDLSESSIRDYINKLINKGIPILKIRQNNKKITLRISKELQKIASLSTLIKLREL